MSEYVRGGNVTAPARKHNSLLSYVLIFTLCFAANSTQNLQTFLAGNASANALTVQESSTILKTTQAGSLLPALPYLLLSVITVALIFLVIRYVAPSIITLLTQTRKIRRNTIIFILGAAAILGGLNISGAVADAGRYRTNTWLETNKIQTDDIDMPDSGIGTIQVKTEAGKTKTLHYNLNNDKINLRLAAE